MRVPMNFGTLTKLKRISFVGNMRSGENMMLFDEAKLEFAMEAKLSLFSCARCKFASTLAFVCLVGSLNAPSTGRADDFHMDMGSTRIALEPRDGIKEMEINCNPVKGVAIAVSSIQLFASGERIGKAISVPQNYLQLLHVFGFNFAADDAFLFGVEKYSSLQEVVLNSCTFEPVALGKIVTMFLNNNPNIVRLNLHQMQFSGGWNLVGCLQAVAKCQFVEELTMHIKSVAAANEEASVGDDNSEKVDITPGIVLIARQVTALRSFGLHNVNNSYANVVVNADAVLSAGRSRNALFRFQAS